MVRWYMCVMLHTLKPSFVPFRTDSFMCLSVFCFFFVFVCGALRLRVLCIMGIVFGFTSVIYTRFVLLAQHMHICNPNRGGNFLWCGVKIDWGDLTESRQRREFDLRADASLALSPSLREISVRRSAALAVVV